VALCVDLAGTISVCPSSIRYKDSVADFAGGLDVLRHLRPVSFRWKRDGTADLGLIAEEVEKVEPRLTFDNANGEVEGVKYEQMSVLLINAVRELADDRDRLLRENETLKDRLERLELTVERLTHNN
jgi:hypothetical protein